MMVRIMLFDCFDYIGEFGFWKIIAVISLVALIQWYYLDWLLERINSKKAF